MNETSDQLDAIAIEVERLWREEMDPSDPIKALNVRRLNAVYLAWCEYVAPIAPPLPGDAGRARCAPFTRPAFGQHVSVQADGSYLVDYDRPLTRAEYERGEWES